MGVGMVLTGQANSVPFLVARHACHEPRLPLLLAQQQRRRADGDEEAGHAHDPGQPGQPGLDGVGGGTGLVCSIFLAGAVGYRTAVPRGRHPGHRRRAAAAARSAAGKDGLPPGARWSCGASATGSTTPSRSCWAAAGTSSPPSPSSCWCASTTSASRPPPSLFLVNSLINIVTLRLTGQLVGKLGERLAMTHHLCLAGLGLPGLRLFDLA